MTLNVIVAGRNSRSPIHDRPLRRTFPRSGLSCVWIETGNSAQPLARVWIDHEMRMARDGFDDTSGEDSAEPPLRRRSARCRERRSAAGSVGTHAGRRRIVGA